jgi:succinate dehydrogenase / fumarate reductase cytochrome b subunit
MGSTRVTDPAPEPLQPLERATPPVDPAGAGRRADMAKPGASSRLARIAGALFSLSGLVPLGAFLAVHVALNARALRGQEAFTAAADAFERVPALRLFEALLVFAPLAIHGAIGLAMTVARRPLREAPSLAPPLAVAMRVTGVVVAAFLAMHLPEMRLFGPGPRLHGGEQLTVLSADLSAVSYGVPWRGIAYLVGCGAVTLHFVVGAWTALTRTRRGAQPAVRRAGAWAAAAVGAALLLFFVDVVVLHATGARLVGSAGPAPVSGGPCPESAPAPPPSPSP